MGNKIPLFQGIRNINYIAEFLGEVYSRLSGGNFLKAFVIDIGDWNMQATSTVSIGYKRRASSVKYSSIMGVHVKINNDANTVCSYNPHGFSDISVDSSTSSVSLTVQSGGVYDNAGFTKTSTTDPSFKTRGTVTLWILA